MQHAGLGAQHAQGLQPRPARSRADVVAGGPPTVIIVCDAGMQVERSPHKRKDRDPQDLSSSQGHAAALLQQEK